MTRVTFYLVNRAANIVGLQDQVILNLYNLLLPITNLEFTHIRLTVSVCYNKPRSDDKENIHDIPATGQS